MEIREILQKRGVAIAQARAVLEKAEKEKRDMTAEEVATYDAAMADSDKLKAQVERVNRIQDAEREKIYEGQGLDVDAHLGDGFKAAKNDKPTDEAVLDAYGRALVSGLSDVRNMEHRRFMDEHKKILRGALQADSDAAGGYLVPPQQYVQELIKSLDDEVFMRRRARVIPVLNSDSLGAPSLDNDPADADWTPEIATVSEDSTMTFGKRDLTPHLSSKLIKVSRKLLRSSALPVVDIINERFTYKFGITEEKAFLTGNGAGQPLGVFTASDLGISTSRDMSTDNATNAITADNIFNNIYNVKAQYRRNASWIFHRDGIKAVRKLKDGDGQYLWRPGLDAGQPDLLAGYPVDESEYAPNTFTTGLYVGLFGDLSYYWIADSLEMEMQALYEAYAVNNQVGYIGRKYTDGMPVLEEAFSRVTLG